MPVDLNKCDREPIHVPGSIPLHGAMLLLDAVTLTDSGICDIQWRQSDGPPVSPASRGGFGTKLIKNSFEYDLRGEVYVTNRRDGVRARFLLPAVHINEQAVPAVEDQLMIAMDTEQVLRQLGGENVMPALQADEALALSAQPTPDVAVLDSNLAGQGCEGVANALQRQGVAFVFATGCGDGVLLPELFRRGPVFSRPVEAATLADKIAQVRNPEHS